MRNQEKTVSVFLTSLKLCLFLSWLSQISIASSSLTTKSGCCNLSKWCPRPENNLKMKQLKPHVGHEDPEIMSISHIHVLLLSSAISLIVSLTLPSWSPVLVLPFWIWSGKLGNCRTIIIRTSGWRKLCVFPVCRFFKRKAEEEEFKQNKMKARKAKEYEDDDDDAIGNCFVYLLRPLLQLQQTKVADPCLYVPGAVDGALHWNEA